MRPSLSSGASPHNLPRQRQALPLRLYGLRGALVGRTARTERGRAPAPGPRGQTRVGLGRAEGLSGRRVPRTFPLAAQRLHYRGRCLLLVLGGGSPRTPALRVHGPTPLGANTTTWLLHMLTSPGKQPPPRETRLGASSACPPTTRQPPGPGF